MGSRKKNAGRRKRSNSTLAQHRQTGKVLRPPLRTLSNMRAVPWLRDIFPDMLWLCALVVQYGDAGLFKAADFIDILDSIVDQPNEDGSSNRPDKFIITGQLTSFERFPEGLRADALAALRQAGAFDVGFPRVLADALGRYEDLPGRWLLAGWTGRKGASRPGASEEYLARVIQDSAHGQSPTATRAKSMVLRAWLKAGKLNLTKEIAEEWAEILPRYPSRVTEEERRRMEPSIRASFMALISDLDGSAGGADGPVVTWAKSFWRQNWRLYKCRQGEEVSQAEEAAEPSEESDDAPTIREARDQWSTELLGIEQSFLEAAHAADPDLYSPDRHEVLSGITYRMLRAVSVLVGHPALWTMEHGSATLRALVEAQIVLKWLILKDDPDLYTKFKDYGRGRLKLLKLHMEEYRDSLDSPAPDLDEQIEYLDALVNQDIWEEFQDISIEGSFSGIDTRKMAEAVGMLEEYRFLFAPMSANVHGEWAALDQYALTVCTNPLHRRHRIPSPNLGFRLGPDLVESALNFTTALVETYRGAIGQPRTSPAVPASGEAP